MAVLTKSIQPEFEVVERDVSTDRCEFIDGEYIEETELGVYSAVIANTLRDEIAFFGRSNQIGRAWMEVLFPIPTPRDEDRLRRPDVAYTTFDRWPATKPLPIEGNPADVIPDLAVEVVSPNDNGEDIVIKLNEYLRAGVRMVWIIFPKERQLYSYTAPQTVRIFSSNDTLDGGDVLPGFQIPMSSIFPERS